MRGARMGLHNEGTPSNENCNCFPKLAAPSDGYDARMNGEEEERGKRVERLETEQNRDHYKAI